MARAHRDVNPFEFSPRRVLRLAGFTAAGFAGLFLIAQVTRAHRWYGPIFADPEATSIANALLAAIVTGGVLAVWLLVRISRLAARYRRASREDDLTRLYTRRHFEEALAAEIERAVRLERSLTILYLDVAGAGAGGERRGRDAGDGVLQGAADALRKGLRLYDTACRVEGDEFAVILPDTSAIEAASPVERIRRLFQERAGDRVALRVGIAEYRLGTTPDELVEGARAAMRRDMPPSRVGAPAAAG